MPHMMILIVMICISNMHVTGAPEVEKREIGRKNIWKNNDWRVLKSSEKKNVDPRSSVELNQDKYIENNHT